MSPQRFLARFRAFKGEEQQGRRVLLLHPAISRLEGGAASLREEACWAVAFRSKPSTAVARPGSFKGDYDHSGPRSLSRWQQRGSPTNPSSAAERPADRPPRAGGMTLWLDAQLPPLFAPWINARGLDLGAVPVGEITLRDTTDQEMFRQVGRAGALVITKDRDFIRLLDEQGPPPEVIGLPVGNGSNAALQPVWSAPFSTGWAGLSAALRQRHWRRTPSPKAAEFSQRLRSLSRPMGFS